MELFRELSKYTSYPIAHQVLVSLLKGYKRPNDKIQDLLSKKILIPIKRGLYITGPVLEGQSPEPILIANILSGPSYVSMTYALSHYGWIPEKVYEVSSVTIKVSEIFKNELGIFTYTKLPLPYYSFGITQLKIRDDQYALMASAEKALCDTVINTKGVNLRSKNEAKQWLAVASRSFTITPYFSHAWVPGERQVEFALKLGFAA
ncbi:MAG: hypothetical protein M3Q58_12250, partial [Bacteroidota bacterium]|nr:hypothetical protein [Bacteroidota bacterium]